jgi:hypothetical protein
MMNIICVLAQSVWLGDGMNIKFRYRRTSALGLTFGEKRQTKPMGDAGWFRNDGFVVLYWNSSNLHLASTIWDYDNS